MGTMTLPEMPGLEVQVRRSRRARRLSLRVSGLDGRVTLTLPTGVPSAEAASFLREKADWLTRAVGRAPDQIDVTDGTVLPLEGEALTVRLSPGRRISVAHGVLLVPQGARAPLRTLKTGLKEMARVRLSAASDHYAARAGKPYTHLSLRDPRSRWGSCSSAGRLMFSWRLILAPKGVLHYVAAHEVAHLVHMHHGPAFWALVSELYPGWRAERDWLRAEGVGLHRYRFGD